MNKLDRFVEYITGEFNNEKQLEDMFEKDRSKFPFSTHKNTRINHCISNIPKDLEGEFVVQESYYTLKDRTNFNSHLFLFSRNDGGDVVLKSYVSNIPKDELKYSKDLKIDYNNMNLSETFNSVVYHFIDGVFVGAGESMFTPIRKFTLDHKIGSNRLVIKESIWDNGRRIFGFDYPIVYQRIN